MTRTTILLAAGFSALALTQEVAPNALPANRPPAYPPSANEQWREGDVRYEVQVDAAGRPQSVVILNPDGLGAALSAAVKDAVDAWRFEPASKDGHPVAGVFRGRAEFRLQGVLASSRMYGRSSTEVWAAVTRVVHDFDLKIETHDPAHHLIVTRWMPSSHRLAKAVGSFGLPKGYGPTEFKIAIYVSPFVEPAHVHINSMVDASNGRDGFLVYNVEALGTWVLDQIDRAAGHGEPLPRSYYRRQDLAHRLGAPACTNVPAMSPVMLKAPPTQAPNRFFSMEPVYPAVALSRGVQGTTRVAMVTLEDGAVLGTKVINTGPDPEFEMAAMGAVSFWRMEPMVVNGCAVSVPGIADVHFSVKR